MKLVSLKREMEDGESEDEKGSECCMSDDKPDYPWGTCISLCEDELEKLGITTMPAVGKPAMIQAMAVVKSTSETSIDGEMKRTLELQITDLAVGMSGMDAASVLYDKGSKK